MRKVSQLFGIGLALLVVVGMATWALATPQTQETFKKLYAPKEGTALAGASCLVCHAKMPPTKTELNPYGKDLVKAAKGGAIDEKAFRAVEKLSSAGDGVSNIDKIKAGLLPGSPKPK